MNDPIDSAPPTTLSARCVPWRDCYREGVLALFSEVKHKAAIWRWQFESNPFDREFTPVVLVDDRDNVVGFNGVMPVTVLEHGREMDAIWSCDFFLADAWRGQGYGSVVKHELHTMAPLIMAFGISNRASVVLRHLGWEPDDTVESFRMIRKKRGLRSWVWSVLQTRNRLFSAVPNAGEAPWSVNITSVLPDANAVDRLWQRCLGDYGRVVCRNYRYLDWRYQSLPLGRYAFVNAFSGGDLSAVLVIRFCHGTLRIVDYCGPESNASLKRCLVRAALRHWRHADQVVSVTSDSQFKSAFLAEGFVKLRGRPRFYIYEPDAQSKRPPWFIMGGDSDGEFLQAAQDFSGHGKGANAQGAGRL